MHTHTHLDLMSACPRGSNDVPSGRAPREQGAITLGAAHIHALTGRVIGCLT